MFLQCTEHHKMLLHPFSKMVILISVVFKKPAYFSVIFIPFNGGKIDFGKEKDIFVIFKEITGFLNLI